jgi:hypothetical protein
MARRKIEFDAAAHNADIAARLRASSDFIASGLTDKAVAEREAAERKAARKAKADAKPA